tara:strand:- start:4598 stop:4900 length:303 start_codon:yes stop_codon:yes gene_type:complete
MAVMFRSATCLAAILFVMSGSVQAACPPPAPGNTAAEIQANGQRLVCLQNEVAAESRQRALERQIEALQRSQQELAIQRRMEAIPPVPVYQPPDPVIPGR